MKGGALNVIEKLEILADAAKYDVACTSSGVDRDGRKGQLGATRAAGCCYSFTPDGRCITLLKVLFTNVCTYDCAYCVNRKSNTEVKRTAFTPQELADLTIGFYRRNYIEGLFLSSGVAGCPDRTTELMVEALRILREDYGFRGYIHAKAIPGTSVELLDQLGRLSDRLSVNLELPSQQSLGLLAPAKSRASILAPMRHIHDSIADDKESRARKRKSLTIYQSLAKPVRRARAFAPAGQSTQMIIGATPESDFHILGLSAALYTQLHLKRVFFSAYLPVVKNPLLPATDAVQLNREHRLYQADWLMRFYGFDVSEIIDEEHPFLEPDIDPKANWALNHLDFFPVEVNTAPLEALLRVPGIGVRGAKLILRARRQSTLGEPELRKLGIAYKRARYFITMNGAYGGTGIDFSREALHARLSAPIEGGRHGRRAAKTTQGQMALFESVEQAAVLPETSAANKAALETAFEAQRQALSATNRPASSVGSPAAASPLPATAAHGTPKHKGSAKRVSSAARSGAATTPGPHQPATGSPLLQVG